MTEQPGKPVFISLGRFATPHAQDIPSPWRKSPKENGHPTLVQHVVGLLLELSEGIPKKTALDQLTSERRELLAAKKGLQEKLLAKKQNPEAFDGEALLMKAAIREGLIPRVKTAIPLSALSEGQRNLAQLIARGYNDDALREQLKAVEDLKTLSKSTLAFRVRNLGEMFGTQSRSRITAICVTLHLPAAAK